MLKLVSFSFLKNFLYQYLIKSKFIIQNLLLLCKFVIYFDIFVKDVKLFEFSIRNNSVYFLQNTVITISKYIMVIVMVLDNV